MGHIEIDFTEEEDDIIKEICEEEDMPNCHDFVKCKILEMVELRKATRQIRTIREAVRVIKE